MQMMVCTKKALWGISNAMDMNTASQPKTKIAHKDGKTEERNMDICYVCMWYLAS